MLTRKWNDLHHLNTRLTAVNNKCIELLLPTVHTMITTQLTQHVQIAAAAAAFALRLNVAWSSSQRSNYTECATQAADQIWRVCTQPSINQADSLSSSSFIERRLQPSPSINQADSLSSSSFIERRLQPSVRSHRITYSTATSISLLSLHCKYNPDVPWIYQLSTVYNLPTGSSLRQYVSYPHHIRLHALTCISYTFKETDNITF